MASFRPISIHDRERVMRHTNFAGIRTTETAFLDLFIWGEHYNTEVLFEDDFMFVRVGRGDKRAYLSPYGNGITHAAIEKIIEDARENGIEFRMVGVTDFAREMVEKAFPNRFSFSEMRDSADYIYTASSIISLEGKKLHTKRTNINKFLKNFDGRFEFEEINADNLNEVCAFQERWLQNNITDENRLSLEGEARAISRAFENYAALDIKGGAIRIDGEICAYSLGTPINDEYYLISIEKGDTSYIGIYQMINKLYAEHFCKEYRYINREEDLGDEGLRRAKLSYRPEFLAIKYEVYEK